jgi:hypothetical protein
MASGSPGGNWKHSAGGGSARPRSTSRRSWQPGGSEPATPAGRRRSRLGRFLLAGTIVGGLTALLVLIILWWWPARYPVLVAVGPNPVGSLALPENVAGANVAAALAGWSDGANRPKLAAPAADTTDRDAWARHLDPDAKSVVLYFAAHGGADPSGPFLWFVPPDARAPADDHKLRVKEILDRIAGARSGKPTLLIFDATAVPASWPHGMLFNDFARALKELDAEIARIDGLVVLCASDEDQRSWVSEEWKQSVFGHFLLEGLRGAVGSPGDRITAAQLFDYAREEVGRWAQANRDEKQTPVLLPRDSGKDRARKIELAAAPPEGYQKPPLPDAHGPVPDDLRAAWEAAEQLANRRPAPDTADPTAWREYLDLLVRWERLVRLGGDPETVKRRVTVMAEQLRAGPSAAEPVCLPAAIPAARALGFRAPERDEKGFNLLWDPPQGTTRADEWRKRVAPDPVREPARRTGAAEQVLARVLDLPTPEVLRTADEVLAVADGPRVGAAEAHFVRMLHRHLDEPKRRPGEDLLRKAIKLRVEAEAVAWVGGLGPGEYPYSEQVYRWVKGPVEEGDRARRKGEDLLFHSDPASWSRAEGEFFPEAERHYANARSGAAVIARALAARDRILARLPYYARWAAAARTGPALPQAEVDKLLAHAEAAAARAHKIAELAATPEPGRVGELKTLAEEADREFEALVKAFDVQAAALTNEVQTANWHALDNALTVPFIPARDRVKLLGFARYVSHQLAIKSEQPAGTPAPPPAAQELARRQGRMALAVLGESSADLRQMVETPKPHAWWESYREAGDRIGKRFRALAADARAEAAKAKAVPELRHTAPMLARAAALARVADPAAPLDAGESPPAAEQRFWRHYFLLWQAERAIADGWADVAPTDRPEEWYARRAARLFVESAEGLIRGSEPNLSPDEVNRRLADCRKAAGLMPVVLDPSVPPAKELTDVRSWEFGFTVRSPGPVGYPVYWLEPPGPRFGKLDVKELGRKLEDGLSGPGAEATHRVRFEGVPRGEDAPEPGRLVTTVLYRGHRYQNLTRVELAGTPTLDWRYLPPRGPAAFAVMADRGMIAGAVTLLIDHSGSMLEKVPGGDRVRLDEVHDALRRVLDDLPENTILTVAVFWGDGSAQRVEPVRGATKVAWKGTANQKDEVLKAVKARAVNPNANTPLADSVAQVLSPTRRAEFWPDDASGVRTLITLTDGVDNWAKGNAGTVIRNALLRGREDTAFHLILFAMADNEVQAARAQYQVLKDAVPFNDEGRTPPEVWDQGVKDADTLARLLKNAMLPRILYQRDLAGGGDKRVDRVQVFLPGEGLYRSSRGLGQGTYNLYGLKNPQRLQLDPGDRVILQARQRGGEIELFIPPTAFNTAEVKRLPRATNKGRGGDSGVHLTVPGFRLVADATASKFGACDLNLTATLEPIGGSPAGRVLAVQRPTVPWFEVEYADGKKSPEPGLKPCLRVVNRPGLVAPAWDLTVAQWDVNRPGAIGGNVRKPAVTGYWFGKLPAPAGTIPVDLRKPHEAAGRTPRVRAVEVLDVSVEEVEPGDAGDPAELPKGTYLTVRLKYPGPGQLVFLRPGALKGTNQPFALYEQHLYFDAQQKYTARFGPLDRDELNTAVDLDLFTLADLKGAAEGTYQATVQIIDRPLVDHPVPDDLTRVKPADR